jgi:uncharacterized OsmC-like protein
MGSAAPDELVVNTVQSSSTATPGRSVNRVRNHELVIDEPTHLGGPGEEITPAEAFLSGIAACGVLLVEGRARDTGVPLDAVHVRIDAIRQRRDTSVFQEIRMVFTLTGPTKSQAHQLVEHYQGH